jgi:hypothetical protein
MLVSHRPHPPEKARLKNAGQAIGDACGRTIWASADSESNTASTRFPESERRSDPVLQLVASPQNR